MLCRKKYEDTLFSHMKKHVDIEHDYFTGEGVISYHVYMMHLLNTYSCIYNDCYYVPFISYAWVFCPKRHTVGNPSITKWRVLSLYRKDE